MACVRTSGSYRILLLRRHYTHREAVLTASLYVDINTGQVSPVRLF
jgi:hypothetical protein